MAKKLAKNQRQEENWQANLEAQEARREAQNAEANAKAQRQAQEAIEARREAQGKARLQNAIRENQDSLSEEFSQAIMQNWIDKAKAKNKSLGKAQDSPYGRKLASRGGYYDCILASWHRENPGKSLPKIEDLISHGEKINMPIPMASRKHFGSHFCHWQRDYNKFLPLCMRQGQKS